MKINELNLNVKNAYLYEGLTPKNKNSMMLWESAGRAIMEAELTADQITQLFQQIEQGASAAGGNRTLIGKGKDASTAVMKAYNDLKSKVANSGPVKGIDALYDQAAEKLKQATGGDQGAMQYVQKYRDFAKKHPIAQGLIYSALIAAAGISGVGAGGAAALGLFKMVDKLLQGEKFSSAAYSGAKTGAMAYAAGQIGKAMKGDQAQQAADATGLANQIPMDNLDGTVGKIQELIKAGKITSGDQLDKILSSLDPDDNTYTDLVMDQLNKLAGLNGAMSPSDELIQNLGGQIANAATNAAKGGAYDAVTSGAFRHPAGEMSMQRYGMIKNMLDAGADPSHILTTPQAIAAFKKTAARVGAETAKIMASPEVQNFESRTYTPEQVQSLFEHIIIAEGLFDKFKTAASSAVNTVGQKIKQGAQKVGQKIAQKAQTVGHNLTTKVTADKLQRAWKSAGSPTDSAAIAKVLQSAGVNLDVIQGAFKAIGTDEKEIYKGDEPAVFTPSGNKGADAQQPTGSAQQPAGSAQQPAGFTQPPPPPTDADLGNSMTSDAMIQVDKLSPEQKKLILKQLDDLDAADPSAQQTPQQQTPQQQAPQPAEQPAPANTPAEQPAAAEQPAGSAPTGSAPTMKIADPAYNPALAKQSSSGGTITPTSTGYIHKANPNNPNLQQPAQQTAPTQQPVQPKSRAKQPKIGGIGPNDPRYADLAKKVGLAESYKEFKFLVDGIKARI